jgi:hypothetical protein
LHRVSRAGLIEERPVSVNVRAVIDLILAGDYLGAARKVREDKGVARHYWSCISGRRSVRVGMRSWQERRARWHRPPRAPCCRLGARIGALGLAGIRAGDSLAGAEPLRKRRR